MEINLETYPVALPIVYSIFYFLILKIKRFILFIIDSMMGISMDSISLSRPVQVRVAY